VRKFRRAFGVSAIGQQILNLALFVLSGNFVRRIWRHSKICQSMQCQGYQCWNINIFEISPNNVQSNMSYQYNPFATNQCFLSKPVFYLAVIVSITGMIVQIIMGVLMIISMGVTSACGDLESRDIQIRSKAKKSITAAGCCAFLVGICVLFTHSVAADV